MDLIHESHILKLAHMQAQRAGLPLLPVVSSDVTLPVVGTNKKSFGDPSLDHTRLVDLCIDNYASTSLS